MKSHIPRALWDPGLLTMGPDWARAWALLPMLGLGLSKNPGLRAGPGPGLGPDPSLVPFVSWSLFAGPFWPVSFGWSLLAGPFLPVPYGFQRLLVLLVCVMSRNWGYSRSLSLVWMVICSVISTNSSTLHSSCLPRMEAIKKSHNKSYCFFFRENKATKILWAKEVINNS